jgi:hypothetical protein
MLVFGVIRRNIGYSTHHILATSSKVAFFVPIRTISAGKRMVGEIAVALPSHTSH